MLCGFQTEALNPDIIAETVIATVWEGHLLSQVSLQKAAGHGDVCELDRSISIALATNSTVALTKQTRKQPFLWVFWMKLSSLKVLSFGEGGWTCA